MPRGRCAEHGLAVGPDGGCVLCRRDKSSPDAAPPPSRSSPNIPAVRSLTPMGVAAVDPSTTPVARPRSLTPMGLPAVDPTATPLAPRSLTPMNVAIVDPTATPLAVPRSLTPAGLAAASARPRQRSFTPMGVPAASAQASGPESSGAPSSGSPASSLTPSVIPGAPPGPGSQRLAKPVVIPSIPPPEEPEIVVSVPRWALYAVGLVMIVGGAFLWSRLGRETTLFPQERANVPAAKAPAASAESPTEAVTGAGSAAPSPVPPATPSSPRSAVNVTFYTTSSCVDCDSARRYLARMGVSFVEWDVSMNVEAQARFKALHKARTLPTFDVEGTVITGFHPEALDRAVDAAVERHQRKSKQR